MHQVSSRTLVLLLALLAVVLVHSVGVGALPVRAGMTWLDNDPNDPNEPAMPEGDDLEEDSPVPESIGLLPQRVWLDGQPEQPEEEDEPEEPQPECI